RGLPLFAQPLEQHVAADGDADGADPQGRLPLGQDAQDVVEVAGLAGVVEARQPVQLAAAGAEVHHGRTPAAGGGQAEQAADVVRADAALEAVQDQQQRRAGRPAEPVDVDEVTVRSVEALAPDAPEALPPRHRPECLDVAVAAPPRGRVGRAGVYSWPVSSSFTISGTISRARRSSSTSVRFAMGCGMARNR